MNGLNASTAQVRVPKLVLLGCAESGKSTLLKQLEIIYGKGQPEKERRTFRGTIYANIIAAMKALCQHSETYGIVEVF